MKHNPRVSNPTPSVGTKPDLRKARMAASMSTVKNEVAQPGKKTWLQGVSVASVLARPK